MPLKKSPISIPTGKGCSFFQFLSTYWWGTQKNSNDRAFHRLCSLMRKMGSERVIVEEDIENDIDERNEFIIEEKNGLNRYYEKTISIKTFRFTFLSENISSITDINKLSEDKFLASATIINFKEPRKAYRSYIHSAVVCRPITNGKFILNNYIHVYKNFKCSVHINKKDKYDFNIKGTYFCQQNQITSVCAHASLCMIINNLNKAKTGNISSEWINNILSEDYRARKLIGGQYRTKKDGEHEGLTIRDTEKVIKAAGHKAISYSFLDNPNTDYHEFIYRYMEGRCPSLLMFSTQRDSMHVVPVIGHTINSDIWQAEAELAYHKEVPLHYIPSSEWVDHFIIHDDNFGMYLCLPVDSLKRFTLPKYDPKFRAYHVIILTPKEVTMPGNRAEWAGIILLREFLNQIQGGGGNIDIWLNRLTDKRTPIVARTMILKKRNYIKHLKEGEDFSGNKFSEQDVFEMTSHLPSMFWLTEITLPDLYTANKSKIIDIITNSKMSVNHGKNDDSEIKKQLIQIRLPGICFIKRRRRHVIPISVDSHYPLFSFEKETNMSEW